MTKKPVLSLRNKLIFAFSLIASFTLISSGAAIYFFKYYQSELSSLYDKEGLPLIQSTDLIQDLQNISLQLEKVKRKDAHLDGKLTFEELENQWRDVKIDWQLMVKANQSLNDFFQHSPSQIDHILDSLPTFYKVFNEIQQVNQQNKLLHSMVLNRQEYIANVFNQQILTVRQSDQGELNLTKGQALNLLTDTERKINNVSRLLIETITSDNNASLTQLGRRALLEFRQLETLIQQLDENTFAMTQNWLNSIRPLIASASSVFQLEKKYLRLSSVLDRHIKLHDDIREQIEASAYNSISFLTNDIQANANRIQANIKLTSQLLIVLAIICILSVSLIIWLFVSRRIIRPFLETSEAMQLLAQGETRISLPNHQDDEVQKMLQSLQVLQQYVIKVNDMAESDGLTKIYNRRYFDQVLKNALNDKHEHTNISLLMCDLDHFKRYNDYYGHQQGDQCLTYFAKILTKLTNRDSDHVCRYGGEEFAIIILNKPNHYVQSLAQLICSETEADGIPHIKSLCSQVVTVSIGIKSMAMSEFQDIHQLITLADEALYQAKNLGRNRVVSHPSNHE